MARMYVLTETSPFMMSYVIITEKNNVVIVDGGMREDIPLLKKYVDGRHISAWILTHAHSDHIDGFVNEAETNGLKDFDIETIYYNFPDYDKLIKLTDVPDLEYFRQELNEILPAFNAVKHKFAEKKHIVRQGEKIDIDEVNIEFLFTYHDGLYSNLMNDSSLAFRLKTPKTSVMFLGDLGPQGGDILYFENFGNLKAEYCQMAHHGHMNVSMEVYEAIAPKACIWNAPVWLYEEEALPKYLADFEYARKNDRLRMYGTAVTRKWMHALGVEKHYVTGYGTQEIDL